MRSHMLPIADRFWDKVTKGWPDGCWLWSGTTNLKYGYLGIARNRKVRAHRFSWELHNGPIPADLHVLHKCDEPSCVNPAHLFLGTQADNNADMYCKGRSNAVRNGEDNGFAKLTVAGVREIRRRLAAGDRQVDIAADSGTHQTNVSLIATGRAWGSVS